MIKIKSKNYIVRDFEITDINSSFINSLNNKIINKFLTSGKKKQNKTSCIKYFNYMKKKKYFYLAIIDLTKKKFIGTITFRPLKNRTCSIGFMISNKDYFGSQIVYNAINKSISYIFSKIKPKKICGNTFKKNLPSNFILIKLGFKMVEKTQRLFRFEKVK